MEDFDYTKLDKMVLFNGPGDLIILKREGRYINLIKPIEQDKRYYRFDLKENVFERINFYKTKEDSVTQVKVKNITGWFKDAKIITKDIHFGRLILFAKYNDSFWKYSSPVRFIQQLGNKMITSIEQWEALGKKVACIDEFFNETLKSARVAYGDWRDLREWVFTDQTKIDGRYTPRISSSGRLSVAPGDLKKEVRDYVIKNVDVITESKLKMFKDHYNNGEYEIEKELRKINSDPEFNGIFHYTRQGYQSRGETGWIFGNSHESRTVRVNLISAIRDYNLDILSFCRFLKRQKNVEKNDIGYLFGFGHHYNDYLECERELCDGRLSKMTKYPNNFRTQFHQTEEEYNAKKAIIDEKEFHRIYEENQHYEHIGRKYITKIAESPKDIQDEALELKHCVRTYIPKVLRRETLIGFIRDKKDPDQPLVTIEIKNGAVTQAYGKNDRKPDAEVLNYLKTYIKQKNLKAGCWRADIT